MRGDLPLHVEMNATQRIAIGVWAAWRALLTSLISVGIFALVQALFSESVRFVAAAWCTLFVGWFGFTLLNAFVRVHRLNQGDQGLQRELRELLRREGIDLDELDELDERDELNGLDGEDEDERDRATGDGK